MGICCSFPGQHDDEQPVFVTQNDEAPHPIATPDIHSEIQTIPFLNTTDMQMATISDTSSSGSFDEAAIDRMLAEVEDSSS
ncbi:hypothetical protein GPJ56_003648 [Histomonas meleagridis]|uniref:uncharacterized protein n=1 Tax=Histomonas meleagridis TaxID=135588 RepID=UPI00355A7D75|nr:hypothetical protein GPJ56_003648 [Histomonas meleagridis]KAH0800719.1 hypothetical protein GO595_006472 [Histomonas meleagridis]